MESLPVGTLYQELPTEIFEEINQAEEGPQNVQEFLKSTLPISDSAFLDQNLRKTVGIFYRANCHYKFESLIHVHLQNIGIVCESHVPRRVKPRYRKTGLSQKERRSLNLYRLPKCGIKYEDASPMRRMWESYIYKFLNLDHLQNKE